jgi:hypothetical protein
VRFRVDWTQSALNDLTTMWIQADAAMRKIITDVSHAIDQRLAANPGNEGESRSIGIRITFDAPLSVRFRIETDGSTVTVLTVSIYFPRNK